MSKRDTKSWGHQRKDGVRGTHLRQSSAIQQTGGKNLQGAILLHERRLGFYCDEWLQIQRNRVKASTYVKYCGILEKHVKPQLGRYPVEAVHTLRVEQFGNELLHSIGLSPKTVKDILTVLRSVLRYTQKQMPHHPLQMDFVYPKVPRREMRVLSRQEQMRLVQFLQKDTDVCKFGILLTLLTGMRIGEVCALRWGNISTEEGVVRVCSTMQRLRIFEEGTACKTRVVVSRPKSDSSARIIPLTDYAIALCQAYRCTDPDAYVLTGTADKYMEPRTMQYRFQKYTRACGLEGVHFHTLRHSFATRCVEVDFEMKSLSEILGHANPRITLERYVHSSMELKRENMNKLASIGY